MFDEYMKASAVTKKYPPFGTGDITYPSMGLAGEAGELLEKVRDGRSTLKDVMLEAGDLTWYGSRLFEEFNVQPGDALFTTVEQLVSLPQADSVLFTQNAVIAACRVLEIAKKALRDSDGVLSEEKREQVIHLTGRAILNSMCTVVFLGGTVERVLELNVEKLLSRKARGVVSGSGDNR